MNKQILNYSLEKLPQALSEYGEFKPYLSKQIFKWLYQKRVTDFSEMTDISAGNREVLSALFSIYRPHIEDIKVSTDGTRKFLLSLSDGASIECVLIKQTKRNTLCISSQVGCAIGCKFCRTATMGLKRNLEVYEIVSQVLLIKDYVAEHLGEEYDFNNIVFMGMGEPFHNLQNVIDALFILTDNNGLEFAPRRITVSTSGLVNSIEKFADSGANVSLAISLNATSNEVRDEIMPINKKWPIERLIQAIQYYNKKTNKDVTLEYVLLHKVNDTQDDINRLAKIVSQVDAKVNLIPYNPTFDAGYYAPKKEKVDHWQKTLLAKKINTRVRWSKGEDIMAACGQLAVKKSA